MDTLIDMAKRAAYFNEMELQVLLESYDEEKDIITRKGNAKASATRITKAWQRIADRVNALVTRQKHHP
jgi:hypothetical protein